MCIKGGYILQPRIIDESKVSKYPPHVREIWLYLLRKANHEDNVTHGTLIKRGQLKTSYRTILDDLSWYVGYRKESYKKHHCETAMRLLTKEHMVTTAKTTRGIIVTICNYDYYQDPKNYETDSANDNETTMKRQSTDTINKNEKNDKNIKKEFDLSFVDVVFMPLVRDFIQYRKEIKKAYKTERGVKQFYNELRKLSNGNYQTAKKLVEHAKGKEWQTVYPIKHEENKRYTGRKNHADERL